MSKCLDYQSLDKHRALIGFELEVVSKKVDRFGWDRDRGTPAHDRLILDWMDALQDFQLDEVQAACRAAIIENHKKCPNEGHVRAIIMRNRGKVMAGIPKQQEPRDREEPTAESKRRIAEMVASVGTNIRKV